MEQKINELKENELEKVSGGGSGTIPGGGIKFSTYTEVSGNRYYSKQQNLNNVVYVYSIVYGMGAKEYTPESISVNYSKGTWSSTTTSRFGSSVTGSFASEYPYMLNIIPNDE